MKRRIGSATPRGTGSLSTHQIFSDAWDVEQRKIHTRLALTGYFASALPVAALDNQRYRPSGSTG
jgi:hypothetical protein